MWNFEKTTEYVGNQNWYQKIVLSNGVTTPGKVDCQKRLKFFQEDDFLDKTVIDLGCNSGFYCLWAKKQGAKLVSGIDIDAMRVEQAKTLAEIEEQDILFYEKSIFDLKRNEQFDVVFCFAVLTEIDDILGALKMLKKVIGQKAYVEMALARPILHLSRSSFWLKGLLKREYSIGTLEIRPTKAGWMISPSLKVVRNILGDGFSVRYLGKGLRYDMISIQRT